MNKLLRILSQECRATSNYQNIRAMAFADDLVLAVDTAVGLYRLLDHTAAFLCEYGMPLCHTWSLSCPTAGRLFSMRVPPSTPTANRCECTTVSELTRVDRVVRAIIKRWFVSSNDKPTGQIYAPIGKGGLEFFSGHPRRKSPMTSYLQPTSNKNGRWGRHGDGFIEPEGSPRCWG